MFRTPVAPWHPAQREPAGRTRPPAGRASGERRMDDHDGQVWRLSRGDRELTVDADPDRGVPGVTLTVWDGADWSAIELLPEDLIELSTQLASHLKPAHRQLLIQA